MSELTDEDRAAVLRLIEQHGIAATKRLVRLVEVSRRNGKAAGRAKAAADTRDAVRYRAIRDSEDWQVSAVDTGSDGTGVMLIETRGSELDAAIDAASRSEVNVRSVIGAFRSN